MGTRKLTIRLEEIKSDLQSVEGQAELGRARRHFRAGMVSRRRRGPSGSPYRTAGYGPAAVLARTYEMIEMLGADFADALDELGLMVVDYLDGPEADPVLARFIGPTDPRVLAAVEKGSRSGPETIPQLLRRAAGEDPRNAAACEVLADALEGVGCSAGGALEHLRSGSHAEACWILNALRETGDPRTRSLGR